MPLYEYECESCGRRFERIQKFSDPPPATCPTCGGPVRKLFSSPAIQFKGSGFYITDYARSGQSAEGGGSEKPGSEKSGSEKGTETGAATPASTKADSSKSDSSTGESSKPAASPKPDSTPKTSGKSGSD